MKIEAIKTQEVELQQQAVILGEKAQSLVKEKELDDIFGDKTEPETKALPVKTMPIPPQKTVPVKTMPVPEQKALPEKTEPIATDETETGEKEKLDEEETVVEKEISPQEKEKMNLVNQLNDLDEMLEKAKENGLDISAVQVLRDNIRTCIDEEKLEEAEKSIIEAKKALLELMEAALPETLRVKILELSSSIDSARGYGISVEDEAEALIVIKNLKEAEKYREAISSIKGIHTSVEEKLLHYEREVRLEKLSEARIEMGTFELEDRSNVDELRAYLDSAKESVEIDDFEAADKFLEKFNEAKQGEPEAVAAPVPEAAPLPKTLPVPPGLAAAATYPAPAIAPKKRVRRIRRKPSKIVKRKVRRVKARPPAQSAVPPAVSPPAALSPGEAVQAPSIPVAQAPATTAESAQQIPPAQASPAESAPQIPPAQAASAVVAPQVPPAQAASAVVAPQVPPAQASPVESAPQVPPAQAPTTQSIPQSVPPQEEQADNTQ